MREYVKPMMDSEVFASNEYCSTCGDTTTYLFTCNAPEGTLYYYPQSDGKIDGVYNGMSKADRLGGYEPCNDKHKAQDTGDFYDGFVDYNRNGRMDKGEGVIVWLEKGWFPIVGSYTKDYHATKNLNMNTWETAKS